MIQRIQSVYLLIAATFIGMMLILPLATYYIDHLGAGHELRLTAFSLENITNPETPIRVAYTVYLGMLLILAAVFPIVNILMFKKRSLQLRLCITEWVLLLGSAGFMVYYIYIYKVSFDVVTWKLGYASFFIIVAAIFNGLAQRAIMKDIKLLRSTDRIR